MNLDTQFCRDVVLSTRTRTRTRGFGTRARSRGTCILRYLT